MSEKNKDDAQAVFMEAMSGIKEYARKSGGFVSKEDIGLYFKGMDLNDAKLRMIYGYLMANGIKIQGETEEDNAFLAMMENSAAEDSRTMTDESAAGDVAGSGTDMAAGCAAEAQKAQRNTVSEPVSDAAYDEDERYLKLYLEDLQRLDKLSDSARAFLLMNIVEDQDKESLRLLSESFLEKIVAWIEPYRRKGVLSSDLIQEGNLAMTAYISEKRFANRSEWREKIKEGSSSDLLAVMDAIEEEVKAEVLESIQMLIDEQEEAFQASNKVLNKVNLVNDWAKRLKAELGRKPTIQEVAQHMGISEEQIREAVRLSAEKIEEIAKEDGGGD